MIRGRCTLRLAGYSSGQKMECLYVVVPPPTPTEAVAEYRLGRKVHRADTGALKYKQPKPLQPVSGAP